MKNKLYWILFCGLLVVGIVSCRKYLDVHPKSQIKENVLLDNEKGFADALTGIYTLMAKRNLYGDNMTMSFMDVLAQRYKSDKQTSPYWDLVHYNYESNNSKIPVKNTLSTIWLSFYNAIANANNILENIDQKEKEFTGFHFELIKGESLALRGMLHFDLLRMFGPILSENPDNPAIPYRVKLDKDFQEVATGKEALDFIIKDLKDAIILLKKDPIITGETDEEYIEFSSEYRKYRMNYWAAKALLARVYLYGGMKEEAYETAKEVIASDIWTFVNSQDISQSGVCKDRTFRNERFFSLLITNMKEYTDEYFANVPTTYEDFSLNNDDAFINAVYDNSSTDYRRQYLWESKSGKLLFVEYKQYDEDRGACPWFKNVVPLIGISEMYYIAAETSLDPGESISLINEVLSHRGLDPLVGNYDNEDIDSVLMKEYQKEFWGEGQLFFYYKRKNIIDIPGTDIPGDDAVYQIPIPEGESIFK